MNKVAIVIGHRPKAPGAYSHFLGETEYQFNSKVANLLTDIADVYERPDIPFVSEGFIISQLVKEINKKSYDMVISLHFNSFHNEQAHGATALYYLTNKFGKAIAKEFVQMISDDFGISKRELIPVTSKKDRGGTLICGVKSPCILVEPFFGSNEFDACQFKDQEAKYAQILRSLIKVIPLLKPHNQ